jgi:hypothetical protein
MRTTLRDYSVKGRRRRRRRRRIRIRRRRRRRRRKIYYIVAFTHSEPTSVYVQMLIAK